MDQHTPKHFSIRINILYHDEMMRCQEYRMLFFSIVWMTEQAEYKYKYNNIAASTNTPFSADEWALHSCIRLCTKSAPNSTK